MSKVFGLIIGVSVTIIILIVSFNSTSSGGGNYKKSCDTDADCPNGICKYDPDYNKKVCTSGKYCSTNPDQLLECDPNGKDCNGCINEPAYACVVVDTEHPYNIKEGDKVVKLPNSKPGKGWCLPPFAPSVHCNPLTADTIMTETQDSKGNIEYQWSCLCKFPDLITKSPGGDCNIEVACGAHEGIGYLYVPDGTTTACKVDTDCTKETGNICYGEKCYKNWNTEKDTDPTKGICKCNSGLKYIGTDQNKMCVSDGCAPHGTDDGKGGCICDKPAGEQGYLGCPNEVKNQDMYNQCKDSPTCLPDPCWPGGTADPSIGCKCKDGYIRVFTPGSAMLYTCKKACDPSVCGVRGTCAVVGTAPDLKESCTACNCPWSNDGDKTNMCATLTQRYLSGTPCVFNGDCCSNNCHTTWIGNTCA